MECLIGFARVDHLFMSRAAAIHERQRLSVDMKSLGGWDCFWSYSEQSVKSLERSSVLPENAAEKNEPDEFV
jgi:hypothetical protein